MRELLYTIFLLFDSVAYGLLKQLYLLFIKLTTTSIIDSDSINGFFNRAWVFVGIIVMLKLAIDLVNYMVNPDDFGDSKKGFGNVVMRVMVSLVLLAFCRLGFQYMYKLQYILCDTHIIETTIFGYNPYENMPNSGSKDSISKETDTKDGYIADSITLSVYSGFFQHDTSADKDNIDILITNDKFTELSKYATKNDVNYIFIISTAAGLFVDYVLLVFCFDIVVRGIKLAIYEALAPIPIIMYIDPKKGTEKLQSWLKAIAATFAELFVRIGILNFVLYVISSLRMFGLSTINSEGVLSPNNDQDAIMNAFIIIGLFMFAKQAPQLLKDITGIEYKGGILDLKSKSKGVPLLGAAVAAAAAMPKKLSDSTKGNMKEGFKNYNEDRKIKALNKRMNDNNITRSTDPEQFSKIHFIKRAKLQKADKAINDFKYGTDGKYQTALAASSNKKLAVEKAKNLWADSTKKAASYKSDLEAMKENYMNTHPNTTYTMAEEYLRKNNKQYQDLVNRYADADLESTTNQHVYDAAVTDSISADKKFADVKAEVARMQADARNGLGKSGKASMDAVSKATKA